jgi:rubrerythrin
MTIDEILDFAIEREQEAVDFYTRLAAIAANPAMKEVFGQFANEERGHKAKLLKVKEGDRALITGGGGARVADLKIADYLVEEEPSPQISYPDALILAMKKEKAAFRLYSDLAAKAADAGVQAIFRDLAQEEAKHKLRFEIEYDEHVLTEN